MVIKTLVLLLFLFTVPFTLTAQGCYLVIAGIIGSLSAARLVSKGNSFDDTWSRFLMVVLGFSTICLVRVDPYALIVFAFFTLGIIGLNARRINSGSAGFRKNYSARGTGTYPPHLYFEGVLTLSIFWFFINVVFSATANIWSLKTWYVILAHHSPAIFPVYGQLASLALFCAFLPLFSSSASARRSFLAGVYAGLWCAIPLVLLQLKGVLLPYVPTEAPFWEFLNRHSGTFEDPNSFGVVIGILLFVGVQQRWYLLSLCWLLLALFSGSRLFTLSLIILLLVSFVHVIEQARTRWGIESSAILLKGAALCMIVALCGVASIYLLARSNVLPVAFYRGLSPLNVVRFAETFSTRTAFWKLGIQIFADNPLFGVGFGNFDRVMTSYARRSGNDLNLWTDTPNNFYFGLLSELGIFGFLIFIFELRKISWKKSTEVGVFLRAGVFVLLLMLFFGTHIYFIECSLIGAFALGCCVTKRIDHKRSFPGTFLIMPSVVFVGLVALLLVLHRSMEYGWYPWERDVDGTYTRWAAPTAQSLLLCKDDRLKFEITLPPERMVEIRSPFDLLTFKSSRSFWQEVDIECRGAQRLPLAFKISKGWMPGVDSPETNDWRNLGVRLKVDPGKMAAPLGIW